MAINYRVFPTAGRDDSDSSYDRGTNLITEYNIASLINQLTDTPGFVINYNSSNNEIQFNIAGYYFDVRDFDPTQITNTIDTDVDYIEFDSSNQKIIATISINNLDSYLSYNYLQETPRESSGEKHSLTILEYAGNNWQIPLKSRIHFNTYIDDGDLDISD